MECTAVNLLLWLYIDFSKDARDVCVFSIIPLIVVMMVPHSVLNFLVAMASLCELARTNDILIIAL